MGYFKKVKSKVKGTESKSASAFMWFFCVFFQSKEIRAFPAVSIYVCVSLEGRSFAKVSKRSMIRFLCIIGSLERDMTEHADNNAANNRMN